MAVTSDGRKRLRLEVRNAQARTTNLKYAPVTGLSLQRPDRADFRSKPRTRH
ncbi:hypothetical protein ACFTWF_34520 [Rhodococcus sp. NPDC056960]|uniref:hypothetical protein n=1 Tax=Rhodococcus sp. NPDC056960 TaxID=3345982 RepID=UPI00363D0061